MDSESSRLARLHLRSANVTLFQDMMVLKWHDDPPSPEGNGVVRLVAEQHLRNFSLWHVEDEARRRDMPDAYIAEQKRKIDRINQERQDYIERIDEAIIAAWPWVAENAELPMNTETPGSVVDRLSIASLKIFHMREEAERADAAEEHRRKCSGRLDVLRRQRADLAGAMDLLLDDLFERRKRLQVYRQFKMYNDPALNPAVYRHPTERPAVPAAGAS